jgi:hypothetical protein
LWWWVPGWTVPDFRRVGKFEGFRIVTVGLSECCSCGWGVRCIGPYLKKRAGCAEKEVSADVTFGVVGDDGGGAQAFARFVFAVSSV